MSRRHDDDNEHLEVEEGSGHLPLIRSPVVWEKPTRGHGPSPSATFKRQASGPDLQPLGYRDGPNNEYPEFVRYAEATYIEV